MNNPTPKKNEDTVVAFSYPICGIIPLAKPSGGYNFNYFDLAHLRRSSLHLCALVDKQLDELLWFSAKVIQTHFQLNGYTLTRRPSASAGARHPIDLIVVRPSQSKVLHYYNPFEHTLNELKVDETIVNDLINHVNENIVIGEATLIWFIAHSDRTAAKYDNPQSLVWRDAGALLHCIQSTCTAMGLGSCPVGTLAEPYLNLLFNNAAIVSAGGIIAGNNLVL
jgi:SagB-type dehydrogenase family enzyme